MQIRIINGLDGSWGGSDGLEVPDDFTVQELRKVFQADSLVLCEFASQLESHLEHVGTKQTVLTEGPLIPRGEYRILNGKRLPVIMKNRRIFKRDIEEVLRSRKK